MSPTKIFYGWYIVAGAIAVGFFTTGLSGYANGILLPHLADTLADGSRGQISLALSATMIVTAIISPFVGRTADKTSPKRIMLFGAVSLVLSYIVLANATSLWHLYLAKAVLAAIALAAVGPLVRSLIVARWFDRFRGRALGLSVLGASIAGVSLPLILNDLVNTFGWRTAVFIFAIAVAGILLPTILFLLKDGPETIGEVPDGQGTQKSGQAARAPVIRPIDQVNWTWKRMLATRALWACGLTFGPMVCVAIVIMVHLFGHAVESGLTNSQAALILSAVALASIIGKPITGWMADILGLRRTLWIALALQASGLLMFAIAGSVYFFLCAATFFGLGYSSLSSMRTYALSRTLGIRSLGLAMGLLTWIELPFSAAASPLAGFIYDAAGSYDVAFFILAGFIALACLGPFFLEVDEPAGTIAKQAPETPKAVL